MLPSTYLRLSNAELRPSLDSVHILIANISIRIGWHLQWPTPRKPQSALPLGNRRLRKLAKIGDRRKRNMRQNHHETGSRAQGIFRRVIPSMYQRSGATVRAPLRCVKSESSNQAQSCLSRNSHSLVCVEKSDFSIGRSGKTFVGRARLFKHYKKLQKHIWYISSKMQISAPYTPKE
uniref:Uncharacterized protein n=1 Tax=Bionectria ochroleuca TaxID=29856 RepID=A0A0B7K186_BIOOC